MSKSTGFLYVAIGKKFIIEANIAAKSLKRFTKYPIAILTDIPKLVDRTYFDNIIHSTTLGRSFEVKITGLINSPFDQTVFLDSDTFVLKPIDDLFDGLELFDMMMTIGPNWHSYGFFQSYQPKHVIKYKGIVPEFNTGVIVMKKSKSTLNFLQKWHDTHKKLNMYADMPTLREAYIENIDSIKIGVLPNEFNFCGINSGAVAYDEIRILHERIGERWNNLRTHAASYEQMIKFTNKLNKTNVKRLILPYFGSIK